NLGDNRFDKNLGPADVQLGDDARKVAGQLGGAKDHYRVGTFMGLNAHLRFIHPAHPAAHTIFTGLNVVSVASFSDTTKQFSNIFGLGVAKVVHLAVTAVARDVHLIDHLTK